MHDGIPVYWTIQFNTLALSRSNGFTVMTFEQIRSRIQELQEQINQLAAELPDDAKISFGTRFRTEPSARRSRKELVITVANREKERPLPSLRDK